MAGLPTTASSALRRDHVAARDSLVASRLAGAVAAYEAVTERTTRAPSPG